MNSHFLRNTLLATLVLTSILPLAFSTPLAAAELGNGKRDQALLNFVGADIESVIRAVGQYTDTTFIIDPHVKGNITMQVEKNLTKSQVYDVLASTLRLYGYALVPADGFVKVLLEADAKLQTRSSESAGARGDQIATQIFSLNYASATNLVNVLRPLISPNNSITANPGYNTLVVTDYADNLSRIGRIIATLDVPNITNLEVLPVRFAIASDIASLVNVLLDAGTPAQAGADNGRVSAMADPRTNSVIIRASSVARASLVKTLVNKLDQPTALPGNIHVVYLKNSDAVKLAKTLRAVVGFDTSSQIVGQLSRAPSGNSMLQAPNSSLLNTPPAASPTLPVPADSSSQSSSSAAGGFIQADEVTNTLLITASEPVYRNIRSVIDQLDTRRAQIYVEALIVEVSDAAASEIGMQWLGVSGDSNSGYRVGGGTGFTGTNTGITNGNIFNTAITTAANSGAATVSLPSVGNGLQIGVFKQIAGKLGFGVLASALNSTTGSNVLSMPNLVTLDNEEAKIVVGQNVPFVTGSYATTGGTTTNPFTTVDRKDVGTALRIKPHISQGGTIRLEISQEVSAVVPSTAANQNGPTTTKRSLDTNVLVDDGEIIALGGLIGDQNEGVIQKVPFLGDLPYIGNLFKYQSGSRNKTNLMIFLRPTIIRDKDQSVHIAADRYDYMSQMQAEVQPRKSILGDLGSAVMPKLEAGGPFVDLRAKPQETPNALPPGSPGLIPQIGAESVHDAKP